MAAASERKTPLINEYLVTNFSNPSLPRGALMDTARISQASQQEIAKKYAHSSEKRKRETGQLDNLNEYRTAICRVHKDVTGRKFNRGKHYSCVNIHISPCSCHHLLLGNSHVSSQALLYYIHFESLQKMNVCGEAKFIQSIKR